MAIGDVFAVYIGTASTNRQPSSGVAEKLNGVADADGTDELMVYDGTTKVTFLLAGSVGYAVGNGWSQYNMGWLYTNNLYLHKAGSTDKFGLSGVQVDA